jgi:ribose transport system permease protein
METKVNSEESSHGGEAQETLASAGRRRAWQTLRGIRSGPLVLLIAAMVGIFWVLSPYFGTAENLSTTALGFAINGIVVIGMVLTLISGGVDLSVGSVLAVVGIVTARFIEAGAGTAVSVFAGIAAGLLCGLINGLLIGKVGLNPLITTLGMMGIARGASYVITQGTSISLYGKLSPALDYLGSGAILGVPVIVIVFVLVAVAGDVLFRRAGAARKVFYLGSNEKAAILSGLNVGRLKVGVYVFSGLLSALAGILMISRFKVATPLAGNGLELTAISAAVIGGASLNGGEGSAFGAALGILMLALIRNILVLENVSVYWQDLIAGIILIGAVLIDHMSHQRRTR